MKTGMVCSCLPYIAPSITVLVSCAARPTLGHTEETAAIAFWWWVVVVVVVLVVVVVVLVVMMVVVVMAVVVVMLFCSAVYRFVVPELRNCLIMNLPPEW